mgnify:FL=1
MTGINYDKLTEEQALDILKEECKNTDIENIQHQIKSASDVLYYKDAYGDLEDAILLQGWDKSLPQRVHRGLLESGMDIYEAVNTHDLDELDCPMCGCDMWRFEIPAMEYTESEWINEHGDVSKHPTFVSTKSGHVWNGDEHEDHASVLCASCNHNRGRKFQNNYRIKSGYQIYVGETNSICTFSACDNLIRWDSDMSVRDVYIHIDETPSEFSEFPKAVATDAITQWLYQHNYERITFEEIKQSSQLTNAPLHKPGLQRVYDENINTLHNMVKHSDSIDYTYVLDAQTKSRAQFYTHKSNKEHLKQCVIEEIKAEAPYLDSSVSDPFSDN